MSDDTAVSETLGTVLMVFLVVLLAGISFALFSGIFSEAHVEKPPLTANLAKAVHVGAPHGDGRVIEVTNVAGDTLYFSKDRAGVHEDLKEVKIYVIPPDGQVIEPVTSESMEEDRGFRPGECLYIFYDGNAGAVNWTRNRGFWLTNDIERRKSTTPYFYDLSQYPQYWNGSAHIWQDNPQGTPAGKGTWGLRVVDVRSGTVVTETTFPVS
ncbi:type IV pilin [Methanofollis formosanus]|nr:type IV pilin [Methanofollis formosanus]